MDSKWLSGPLAMTLAASVHAAVINVTSDTTYTDADQTAIAASEGFSISSGVTLTFNVSSALTLETAQPIRGAGNVAVTGKGKLHIKGANPDFTGKITVNTAALHVYNQNSTGPDNGKDASGTELVGKGSIHLHKCNLFEQLKFPETAGAYIWADEGDCYLCCNPSGKYQPAAATGATFHTQSTWVPWCNQNVVGGGTVDFNSAYMGCFEGGIYNNSATTVLLSKQPNQSASITYRAWSGQGVYPKVVFSAVDVGNKYKFICNNNAANWCNNIMDLNGNNQTAVLEFTCPYRGNGNEKTLGSIMKSASPAYLRALASGHADNAVAFTEHAGFRWAGSTDLNLIEVSTSDNELWVESSKLTISATASWKNAPAVRATGTGVLCLSHAGAIGSATKVYLTDSGKVEIPAGVTVDAGELSIGGTEQAAGTYGGTGSGATYELPERFSGTGLLRCRHAQLAIAEDTTWSAADYANACAQYAQVSVASGKTLTFDVPAGSDLEIGADFDIAGEGTVKKTGAGSLHLKGENSLTGEVTVNGGSIHVYHNNALGPDDSSKTILNANTALRLHNVTLREKLDFQGGRLWGEEGYSWLKSNPAYSTSVNGFFSAQAGATLEVCPTFMPNGHVAPTGDGTIVFNSDYLCPYGGWYHNTPATIVFKKGCYSSTPTCRIYHGQYLPKCRLAAKDVANTIKFQLGHEPGWNNAELDLDGYDQTAVPSFEARIGNSAGDCPVVKSSKPAYLRALSSGGRTSNGAIFTEHAGFVWAGTDELELSMPSTSDGVLAVDSGTLTMGANGSWTNAPTVTAKGTGTLRLLNKAAFSRDVTFRIEDQGKFRMDCGKVRVKALYINGQLMPNGLYGATGSSATTPDDVHFAGTGVVQIGRTGAFLIIR